MTTFEFVFALYSIIVSLAVTHMLAGLVGLWQTKAVRVYTPQLLWTASAFIIPIGNWAALWELRRMTDWPSWSVLLLIFAGVAQYVFCALMTPHTRSGEEADLRTYYENNRIRYLAVMTAFVGVTTTFNLTFGGADYFEQWLRNQSFNVVAYFAALIAFLARPDWIRIAASAVMIALMTYFLIVATNLPA